MRLALARTAALAAAASALLFCTSAAEAQEMYYRQEPFRHEGLFLKLDAGIGYLNSTANYPDNTSAQAYGGAGYIGLTAGGFVQRNLLLFGEIWGMGVAGPTFNYAGTTTQASNNTSLNYGGIGVGIGTFIMPANVFLGLSVDATRLGIRNYDNGDESDSDIGGAVTLTAGKQFWLTDQLGLGVEIKGIGGGNRDNNNDANSTTYKTFTGMGLIALTFG